MSTKSILTGIFFCVLIFELADYLYNKFQISDLVYGVQANKVRLQIHVPIIDDNMEAIYKYDEFSGNRWESSRDYPSKRQQVIHYWKNVDIKQKGELDKEWDAYRKFINDSLSQQLNISSNIISDSISVREGLLFFISKNKRIPRNEKKLNEWQIDSVALAWGLNDLVKR